MVLECWVIILILGIAAYMFARSRRRVWSIAVLPLMLTPLANIVYSTFLHIRYHSQFPSSLAKTGLSLVYLLSFIVTAVWVLGVSRKMEGKSRYAYIVSSVLFTALLIILLLRKQLFV